MENSGLTFNKNKCVFSTDKLEFFGLSFSKDGISIHSDKIDALQNAKQPKNQGELRSFLGLASYCSRFIKDFATVVQPLRQLTKKNQRFEWLELHQNTFDTLKTTLTTTAMAYYNKDWKTVLTVDASPVGLGVVMTQYDPNDHENIKIIQYASRTLTNTEMKYSQVEREALAVVWACEKLHLYIYANDFEIITDNKAVELIFGNPTSKPKARIERWCLRLLPYKFKIVHKPGSTNIADFISRNPLLHQEIQNREDVVEGHINLIAELNIPKSISKAMTKFSSKSKTG